MGESKYWDLVRLIDADIVTAEWALVQANQLGIAAYHIQQAFEKLLKLVLYSQNVFVPKTHDLYTLVRKVKKQGLQVPVELQNNATFYTHWEAACRYDYDDIPNVSDVQFALQIVKQYYAYVVTGGLQTK